MVIDPYGVGSEALYEVNKASNNRRCKKVMTLKEIMDMTTLTNEVRSNLSMEQYEMILQEYASQISITGFPFKDGLKITPPDGKVKSFTSATTTIQLQSKNSEDETVVLFSFGKTTILE